MSAPPRSLWSRIQIAVPSAPGRNVLAVILPSRIAISVWGSRPKNRSRNSIVLHGIGTHRAHLGSATGESTALNSGLGSRAGGAPAIAAGLGRLVWAPLHVASKAV